MTVAPYSLCESDYRSSELRQSLILNVHRGIFLRLYKVRFHNSFAFFIGRQYFACVICTPSNFIQQLFHDGIKWILNLSGDYRNSRT